MWFPSWAPVLPQPPCEIFPTEDTPKLHADDQHKVTAWDTDTLFSWRCTGSTTRPDVQSSYWTTGHVGESPAASYQRGTFGGTTFDVAMPVAWVRRLAQDRFSPTCGTNVFGCPDRGLVNLAIMVTRLDCVMTPHQAQPSTLRHDMTLSTTDCVAAPVCDCPSASDRTAKHSKPHWALHTQLPRLLPTPRDKNATNR